MGGDVGESTTSSIEWLPAAVEDLIRVREFIRTKNPTAAKKAAERISSAITILQDNPEVGRPLFDGLEGFRDLVVPFGQGGYVIRYRMNDNVCVIVRLWHTKEDYP